MYITIKDTPRNKAGTLLYDVYSLISKSYRALGGEEEDANDVENHPDFYRELSEEEIQQLKKTIQVFQMSLQT